MYIYIYVLLGFDKVLLTIFEKNFKKDELKISSPVSLEKYNITIVTYYHKMIKNLQFFSKLKNLAQIPENYILRNTLILVKVQIIVY